VSTARTRLGRVAVGLAFAGSAVALAAISAAPANAVGADPAGADRRACVNWSLRITEGHATGQQCQNNRIVRGTVTDDKADGRCPFVRVRWSNGGITDGPWVGPKGATKSFTLNGPGSTRVVARSMHWVSC